MHKFEFSSDGIVCAEPILNRVAPKLHSPLLAPPHAPELHSPLLAPPHAPELHSPLLAPPHAPELAVTSTETTLAVTSTATRATLPTLAWTCYIYHSSPARCPVLAVRANRDLRLNLLTGTSGFAC